MCLLNENVPINWKCAYWIKMCLLKGYNPLGINSGSYSFDKFFLTSFSFIFLKKTKNLWVFSKITICKSVFFFWLNSEKVQESSHTKSNNNNTGWFLYMPYECYSYQISHFLRCALPMFFFSMIVFLFFVFFFFCFCFNVYILCEAMSRYWNLTGKMKKYNCSVF